MKSVFNKDQNHYYYNIFLKNVRISKLKNKTIFFDSIIMLRFGETRVANKNFMVQKNPINIWDVNVNDIVVSKLI